MSGYHHNNGRWVRAVTASVLAIACGTIATQASAEQAPDAAVSNDAPEIIVTATRRAESLTKTPIAIGVLQSSDMIRRGITDPSGIQGRVPGVTFAHDRGIARINVRGIGFQSSSPGVDSSVAFNLDGVYIARPAAATTAFLDVDRIEVLRGPQVTLYGRNATGGAINVLTKDPTEDFQGYATVTFGNYNTVNTQAAVGGKLAEGVSARLAVGTNDHSGFGKNLATGEEVDNERTRTARLKLLITPSPDVDVLLTGDYYRAKDNNNAIHIASFGTSLGVPVTPPGAIYGHPVPTNLRDVRQDAATLNRREFWGLSSKVVVRTGGPDITWLQSYRKSHWRIALDLDGYDVAIQKGFQQEEWARQFTEEVYLTGKTGMLDYLVGATYFHESLEGGQNGPESFPGTLGIFRLNYSGALQNNPVTNPLNLPIGLGGTLRTNAYSAYGELKLHLTDTLHLTGGARYSYEKKDATDYRIVGTLTSTAGSKSWDAFTPKVTLDYQVTPEVMLYATFSKGFKSGGFSLGSLQPAYNPEKVTTYEAGLKSRLFDGKATLNLAAFHYDYSDLQLGLIVNQGLQLTTAKAKIDGVEGEFSGHLGGGFSLDLNGTYLNARYVNFSTADNTANPVFPAPGATNPDLSGNQLTYAPKWRGTAGLEYETAIGANSLKLRGEYTKQSKVYFTPFNRALESQGAYGVGNLYATFSLADGKTDVTGFVKNVGNTLYFYSRQIADSLWGRHVGGYLGAPRTFGATVTHRF